MTKHFEIPFISSMFITALRNGDVKPKKKARVAILDTGIDSDHEDLKGNYKSTDKRYDSDTGTALPTSRPAMSRGPDSPRGRPASGSVEKNG